MYEPKALQPIPPHRCVSRPIEDADRRNKPSIRMAEIQRDITRGVLAVLFIVTLIGSSIWILRPFIGAIVWAATIVVATWPLMISLQAWLWGKRHWPLR